VLRTCYTDPPSMVACKLLHLLGDTMMHSQHCTAITRALYSSPCSAGMVQLWYTPVTPSHPVVTESLTGASFAGCGVAPHNLLGFESHIAARFRPARRRHHAWHHQEWAITNILNWTRSNK
jgi:hypothetical protein